MVDLPPAAPESQAPEAVLHQARVVTASGQAMLDLLEGREIELVGRGPHRRDDGSYAAEIIARRHVLDDLSEALSRSDVSPQASIEVRSPRETPARAVQLSKRNRYLEDSSVPHGVGVKD